MFPKRATGSEHDVGWPPIDHVNAQSDSNVLDRGILDMVLYTQEFKRIGQLAGGKSMISLIGNQIEQMDLR